MKIAQVSPLYERVSPLLYGGTERVVSFLTEALVRDGHDVTLFASADSITTARLMGASRSAVRLDPSVEDPVAHHTILLDRVARHTSEFDLVHFHTGYLHFPLSRQLGEPNVTTLHGRLNIPDLADVYENFPEMPVVSISDAQRAPLPRANWQASVHHGLPEDLFAFQPRPGEHLAFVGRTSPEKRPDRAIEIAERAGMRLKIAAKVDAADRAYFESKIRPLLSHPRVEFVGEIGEQEKGSIQPHVVPRRIGLAPRQRADRRRFREIRPEGTGAPRVHRPFRGEPVHGIAPDAGALLRVPRKRRRGTHALPGRLLSPVLGGRVGAPAAPGMPRPLDPRAPTRRCPSPTRLCRPAWTRSASRGCAWEPRSCLSRCAATTKTSGSTYCAATATWESSW